MIKKYKVTNLSSEKASMKITVAYGDKNDLMMSFAKEGLYLNIQKKIWELTDSSIINKNSINESSLNYTND